MDKNAIRKTTIQEQGTDYSFWMAKNHQERLEAIEFLRQQYIAMKKDVPTRFQRIYRIIERRRR